MSSHEHKAQAPASVACFVVTVSDTRTEATDTGGRAIRELLEASGHTVSGHTIVSDEPAQVTLVLEDRLADAATQVIITTGGTGISARDTTFEAVTALFDKRLVADRHSEHCVGVELFEVEVAEASWLIADLQRDREAGGL